MRLHTLEVTSFGPFAQTVTVDFDELGADGLFLLHGQTGAGKTTILDAVAFALYGTVPGARKDGKRLLSDHAPAGSVPTVTLRATIGGRPLRITRNPEYQRPKKRGTGTLTENAKATLEWLDGTGENLSRIPDIAREVERLLGMTADQFFQVVLLPQGEFAKFLRADNEDRGKLLEKLFDTTRFKSVEQWFVERRRASAARVEDHRKQVDLLLARVSTAAGIEVGTDGDPLSWSRRLLDEAVETVESATTELTRVRDVEARARAAAAEAQRRRDLQVRRARALAELEQLEAGAPERDRLAAEADRARRADVVGGAAADAASAARAAESATDRAGALAEDLRASPEASDLVAALSWPQVDADRDAIRARARDWTAEVVRLDALVAEAASTDALAREVEDMRRRGVELSARAADLETARAAWPQAVRDAEEALRAAEKAQACLPAAEEACARAADAAAAAQEWRTTRKTLDAQQSAVVSARGRHQDARELLLDLRERRIAGMAAELAAGLLDGEKCAVCGSLEHPAPARAGESSVTKADEDAARTAEQKAAARLDAETARVTELERAVDLLVQRGGDGDPAELRDAYTAASAEVDRTRAAAARVPDLSQAVDDVRARGAELEEQSRLVGNERAVLETRIDAAEEQVRRMRERMAEAAGDDPGVPARRERFDALATRALELLDARDRAATLAATARELAERTQTAAADAGFASLAEALEAVRSAARIEEIDAALTAARERIAGARAVLADPDVEAVAGIEPVDPSGAESLAREAVSAVEAAATALAEADTRRTNIERLTGQLEATMARLGPVLAEHDELAGLADIVEGRGQNSRKMSLRSYVLASRLEEVAVSASVRLRRMSAGRYEFVHSDEAGARGRRGGLGLDIRDDYTGVVRSAKTLSGGESFLASLALALGLADVVAAESGGVVLDTMFIDEGFGTLDADTLDLVMGVLDELRAGGRVVGIVSHVDEMRQRIPSRLHVVRGRTGSTLEMIAG
ncbi:AAA family ATPase [Rhodococcus sp. SGAir0479]|uniref:AAA family ATPase n=1 Tax=Rhodococcus sp. SGAir0479 TaxID=2567884 RepID=UPI0010CD3AFF|nr:SMC family ATPase [Rhodococcus sp. SGAir0479]QCQ90200.1 SMC family ATPase [Rhodococcus sp. SGAir0479]